MIHLGTMNFGGRTNEDESRSIIDRAIDLGVTWFDTANAYNDGRSEEILGRALVARREKVQLATKVGLGRSQGKFEGLARTRILRAIDESLLRLGTDYVDLYYLHVPDYAVPLDESIDAIAELLAAKKIRAWGMSNYASWQILQAMTLADARGIPRPAWGQQLYNVLVRQLDVEYFKFTRAFPIRTAVYNPLAGGILSGRHARDGSTLSGSRFDKNKRYRDRYWHDASFDRVEALASVAKDEGVSVLTLAYAWIAAREGVDAVLVGPGTVGHLDDAATALSRSLQRTTLDRIDVLYTEWMGTEATYAR